MEPKTEQHIVGARTFVPVWIALLCLTGLTVLAARLQLGAWGMVANILIASAKAGLVLGFFMHLKYERRFFRNLVLIPIATITIIIVLTFFDIWYR